MPDIVWSVIAFSLGLLIYLIPGALGGLLPMDVRKRVGMFYYRMSMRSFRRVALVRRLIGGLELHPISIDAEQKLAQVTLSSSMIGSDKKLPFKDPDNRIRRLCNKPLAVVVEEIPAAIDAEVAEMGYWIGHHVDTVGWWKGEELNTYVKQKSGLRVIDPIHAWTAVTNDVEPETVETTKQLTKQRFQKYGSRIGAAETIGTLMGFAVGVGAVATIAYINEKLLDGATNSNPVEVWPLIIDTLGMIL